MRKSLEHSSFVVGRRSLAKAVSGEHPTHQRTLVTATQSSFPAVSANDQLRTTGDGLFHFSLSIKNRPKLSRTLASCPKLSSDRFADSSSAAACLRDSSNPN